MKYRVWVSNAVGTGWVKNDDEYSHAEESESEFDWSEAVDCIGYVVQFVDRQSEFRIVPVV